jgi:hypothetical protein
MNTACFPFFGYYEQSSMNISVQACVVWVYVFSPLG